MIAVIHSTLLISSLWRVFLLILSSQSDIPSLTNVTLERRTAFRQLSKSVHTKSSCSSFYSFLDITYALWRYLSFPLSFIYFSSIPHSYTNLTPSQKPHTLKRIRLSLMQQGEWAPLHRLFSALVLLSEHLSYVTLLP